MGIYNWVEWVDPRNTRKRVVKYLKPSTISDLTVQEPNWQTMKSETYDLKVTNLPACNILQPSTRILSTPIPLLKLPVANLPTRFGEKRISHNKREARRTCIFHQQSMGPGLTSKQGSWKSYGQGCVRLGPYIMMPPGVARHWPVNGAVEMDLGRSISGRA